jgi:hypothetical protein
MHYGGYEHVLAKEKMRAAIEERERDRLAEQLRSAGRGPRSGPIVRSAAVITALFR